MTIRQGNIQLGMFILLVDVLTDNWGSCPSPVLVHKVCTELQVGSTSSSSFFTEGWGEIKGTYSLTPPCPDLFKPVGPKPVEWTLWPSPEKCHQGIQGPTSSFSVRLGGGRTSVEVCPGASKARAGGPPSNALSPASGTGAIYCREQQGVWLIM